ncbi:multidrug transporter [Labrys miyagiensis]|uniref:Multidrug transporter n=2 Tax=Labrys miyagiensis TaxID=346912 RepID=A0ABQ6CMH7_9HYPH|nr:multidrug transporter [Labrys miyagiensis]
MLALVVAVGTLAVGGKAFLGTRAGGSAPPAAKPTAIPVTVAKVTIRDLPIERSGLGTVTSLNAIDVKFRADGQLQNISLQEGRDVQAGDVLAQIDRRPYEAQLAQAEAAYQKDTASLNNAKADEARANRLSQTGAGTMQAIDTARSQVAVLTAALAGDQAAIDAARLNLEFTTVKAPIAGRVGLRQIDEGAVVHASDSSGLVSITQMAPISVRFSLPQDDLPALLAGQAQRELAVAVDSRDGTRHLADGKLAVIDSQVDTSTGMIRLKAIFPNQDQALWPGELVTARILIRTDRNAVVVPSAAVQNGQNGSYIFIIKSDGSVAAAPVKTGPSVGDFTALLSGASPGQDAVLDGQSRLANGSLVSPREQPADGPATSGNAS